MNNIIIYQKPDGTKFLRSYVCTYGRKIGDETAMGWKVLNVLYEYEGNYYQYDKYIKMIRTKIDKQRNKKIIRQAIKKKIYNFLILKMRTM